MRVYMKSFSITPLSCFVSSFNTQYDKRPFSLALRGSRTLSIQSAISPM